MSVPAFAGVRAVLFDLDGTLIDSAPDLGAAVDAMRTARGLPALPLAAYRSVAGAGARGMLGVAFGMATDHPDFPAYREEFFCRYEARMAEATRVFDGVPELVHALSRHRLPWGVVTNKTSRFTAPLMQRMAQVFGDAGAVVSGDSTPHTKPHPAPLLAAAAQLQLAPGQCIYVGDDPRDIEAGHAAGMGTVAALYGYLGEGAHPRDWGAHASIEFPLALLKLLALD